MGNQPSKDGKSHRSSLAAEDAGGIDKNNYPSFSRSDTKESSRSIRNSIRNKIPGTGKNDSPRNSAIGLPSEAGGNSNGMTDKSDAGSVKSSTSGVSASRRSRRGSSSSAQAALDGATPRGESPQPPPSPTQSSSLGHGHGGVDQARRTGEVDYVSEVPPTGVAPIVTPAQPKESILQKTGQPIPRVPETPVVADGSGSPMELSALKEKELDDMIQRLLDAAYAGKVTKTVCLKNAEIYSICHRARELFLSQPALLELSPPVKIVGDVHGQYTDLIRMFEMCGFPPHSNYLFLGDYVDRGKQSLETILLLLCYKLKYPENFFLLRGNHECANVTRVYGFYDECKRRCNVKVWKAFVDTFNTLPIAAIVAGKIFCVHGGLSPSLQHMDDIRQIARPTDVPDYGLLNDLLWSDPADMENDWESNERGVSYCFGKKVIMEFLQRHDFDLVCRAHMVVEDGYEFFNDRILVTVFSAPNYCGEFDNWGAVMSVSAELLCSFELLKPLDSSALKSHIKKGRNKRQSMLNSPVEAVGEPQFDYTTSHNEDQHFNTEDGPNKWEQYKEALAMEKRGAATRFEGDSSGESSSGSDDEGFVERPGRARDAMRKAVLEADSKAQDKHRRKQKNLLPKTRSLVSMRSRRLLNLEASPSQHRVLHHSSTWAERFRQWEATLPPVCAPVLLPLTPDDESSDDGEAASSSSSEGLPATP